MIDDPLTQIAFSVYEGKGVYVVLLGSGVSRAAGIPTGWEITLDLIRRVATAEGVADQPDWAKWYQDKFGEEPNYSTLLAQLAGSPAERRAILHSYIEPTEEEREEGKKVPTAAHHAIASLVRQGYIRVIITTNFDRLMENALREQGVEPTVVASADALNGAEPLTHSQCYVLKLHGDYMDARILNTDEELNDYPECYQKLLDRILDEHGLIVCGWSGDWDHALRAAIMRAPNRRYSTYWALRGDPSESAKDLIRQRAAKEVRISDANDLFQSVLQRVETLQQTRRQSPVSIDLLVNSAKRFLAKPEYRIQLDELVAQEVQRLVGRLNDANLTSHPQVTKEEFYSRVQIYESLTDPLAQVSAVLGRWGAGDEFSLVADAIKVLWRNAESERGGTVIWLNLHSYPAVLIFTAYCLGLIRGQRWGDVHALFQATITTDGRNPQRIVEVLFSWAWKGANKDYWKLYDGLEQRKTPFNDHLSKVAEGWRNSFAGLEPHFQALYARFEFLGALAHLEQHELNDLEAAFERNPNEHIAWMPVGRIGWDASNLKTLLQEFENEKFKSLLLISGFAKQNPRFFELFLHNLSVISQRMSW